MLGFTFHFLKFTNKSNLSLEEEKAPQLMADMQEKGSGPFFFVLTLPPSALEVSLLGISFFVLSQQTIISKG